MSENKLSLIEKALADSQGLPPVHQWQPEHVGEVDIRIARDGTWYYQDSPIERQRMVNLFSTILLREGDDFFLVTPVEKLRITVDDAPFVITTFEQLAQNGEPQLVFQTNVGTHVTASAEHPLWVKENTETGEPSPYLRVRDNLNALIGRNVFYQLVDIAQEEGGQWVLRSGGETFSLDARAAAE